MGKLEDIRKKLNSNRKPKNRKPYFARKWKNKKIPEDYTYDESMVQKIPTKSQIDTYVRYEDATEFYFSNEWADLRNFFIARKNRETSYNLTCNICKCKITPETGLNVDHIKPVRLFWYDRLKIDNLQIVCVQCNINKGNDYD
jgi:5-methylcytosine-specific restriction endonuclease McrA